MVRRAGYRGKHPLFNLFHLKLNKEKRLEPSTLKPSLSVI
jgi:hypothetical protein